MDGNEFHTYLIIAKYHNEASEDKLFLQPCVFLSVAKIVFVYKVKYTELEILELPLTYWGLCVCVCVVQVL